jgi:hypothetical protein
MPVAALSKGVLCNSIVAGAATTATSTAYAVPISADRITTIVAGTGTLSAGVITVEAATNAEYTGTWFAVTTVAATLATGTAQTMVHTANLLPAIRARISTTITGGGTVTVSFYCD